MASKGHCIKFCQVLITLLQVIGTLDSSNVCVTNGCLKAASAFLSNMDPSVDPCNDFYSFACGRFLRRSRFSPVQNVRDESHRRIISQLTSLLSESTVITDSESVKKTKQFFYSCVHSDEKNSLESLSILLKSLGGWPTAQGNDWNEDQYDITELLTNVISLGITSNHLFGVRVIEKEIESTLKYGILINQPFESLDRNLYENNTILEAYKTLLVDIAVQLDAPRWQARREVEEMMIFYLKVIAISSNARADELETSVMGLWRISNMVNWSNLLSGIFKRDIAGPVTVQKIEYFHNLFRLLLITPKRVVANFVLRSVIDQFLDSLGMASETFAKFYSIISPMWKESRESRPIRCMHLTSRYFLHSMTSMYVRKYFKRGQKKAVEEMGAQIRQELVDRVNEFSWLQFKLKQQLKDKISKVALNIGFDTEILYAKKLSAIYKHMNITSSFLLNSVMAYRTNFEDQLSKLNQEVDRSTFADPPPITQSNAFYFRETNSISLSVPLLTDIYFALDRPKYLNYGSLGTVIGHEFSHTIDYLDENFAGSQWWDIRAKMNYDTKRKCFKRLYQKYLQTTYGEQQTEVSDANIENIADSIGLELTFLAYDKQQTVEESEEPRLLGFDLTSRQLFWLSYANVWCRQEDPVTLQELLKNSSRYAVTQFRVNDPLSNIQEFADDYQCPLGSPMNPKSKCSNW